MEFTVKAPAKINLALDIKEKRKDGYHNVEMVMQTIDLYDEVKVSSDKHGKIVVDCKDILDIEPSKNTAYKAASLFFEYMDIKNPGINISIKKHIPIEAGLAGGSTDAAAVLVALNRMFKTNCSNDVLAKIGAKIGADVPFCIYGGTMLASGTGTNLKRIKDLNDCLIVLAKPNISVSTKEAYQKADEVDFLDAKEAMTVVKAIESEDIEEIGKSLFNRFEQVIDKDEVEDIKRTMYENCAISACMSGSGPSVFSLYTDEEWANLCMDELKAKYKNVYLCKPLKYGCKLI